jgi:hypothetical protein
MIASSIILLRCMLSTFFYNPNPDLEKIDVTDHTDLERFF